MSSWRRFIGVLLVVIGGTGLLVALGWIQIRHKPPTPPIKVAVVRLDEVRQAHPLYARLQALERQQAESEAWQQINRPGFPEFSLLQLNTVIKPQTDLWQQAKARIEAGRQQGQFYAKQEETYVLAQRQYLQDQQTLESAYQVELADLRLKLASVSATAEQKQAWQKQLDNVLQAKNAKLAELAKQDEISLKAHLTQINLPLPVFGAAPSAWQAITPGAMQIRQLANQSVTSGLTEEAAQELSRLRQTISADIEQAAAQVAAEQGVDAILDQPILLLQPIDVTQDLILRIKQR